MPTEVRACTCANSYQDKKYGNGKRVHNLSGVSGSQKSKCTVCGSQK